MEGCDTFGYLSKGHYLSLQFDNGNDFFWFAFGMCVAMNTPAMDMFKLSAYATLGASVVEMW